VREGRSFDPSEFAIALEQVVDKTAPEDYRDPVQFFNRTCFTRALKEHMGLVLRRLAGETQTTAPVMALITQFGGGKTHTLTALYHLIHNAKAASGHDGVRTFLKEEGLSRIPSGKVAVFVGNAWDPSEGKETPWLDIAQQLAGGEGVAALGPEAKTKAPGTDNLRKLFEAAGGQVLVLCDEVLNFLSRHRDRAESFRDFLANLVRAMTGTTGCAAMVSLPQSKPEMHDWDLRWQEIIVKEVGRVAKQLIANDETEISEVVRRRLFEDLGSDRVRGNVARAYADWCFERRAQLPPEWTAVDTSTTESKAREHLRQRFEMCYPFHPATLSVFQRKWQALPHYQQTRGTLAMFAQWISWAYHEGFRQARTEPLITLGSAPLHVPDFRGVALSQLNESRLSVAIEVDVAGEQSHAKALDADTKGETRDIHKRVGATIFFESSGGMADKVAHLPELRFALGGPEIDTTSVDNAALSLESRAFYIRKVGTDGFQIRHKPRIKKVVNDRRASLDEKEVKKSVLSLVRGQFKTGASIPTVFFPEDSAEIQDSPRLTLVVMDPAMEWSEEEQVRQKVIEWSAKRGTSNRLYPAARVWCFRKPGRDLQEKVEQWLAWNRVKKEISDGLLGSDFDRSELDDVNVRFREAQEDATEEVWAGYRYVVLTDKREEGGLKIIDLGAGHASAGETLCGRVIAAMKSENMLNESVGPGFIERNWPPALKETGEWPLSSLRQSFLDGSLTRLLDPDTVLGSKIVECVGHGDLGLASGKQPDGGFARIWFSELVPPEEVLFEPDVYLLTKKRAKALKAPQPEVTPAIAAGGKGTLEIVTPPTGAGEVETISRAGVEVIPTKRTLRISGSIPPEVWNRLGTKILPKLKSGGDFKVGIDISVTLSPDLARSVESELRQILDDLGLSDKVRIGES
jgi:hypothetical protein